MFAHAHVLNRYSYCLTLIPPILCSPLNSLPFFSQFMVGVGLPAAGQRNFTVLAAGTANSFFSIRSGRVQYGASVGQKYTYENKIRCC